MTRPTHQTFEAWNEEMSRKYNPDHYHRSKNPLLRFMEGKRTRIIIRSLSIRPSDKVLDVGCGAGNMLELFQAKRTGIDLSETMIERSRKKLGPDVELRKMSADALEFPENSFDKIICSEVIEHVLDPRRVLQEIARVLKPGGLAAISIPNESLIEGTKKFLRGSGLGLLMKNEGETNLDENENEWHLHHASFSMFRTWNQGLLQVVRTKSVPFFWLPFRYVFLLQKQS